MLTLRPLRVAPLSPSLPLLRSPRALAHASRYTGGAELCPVARSRRRDGARHAESCLIPRLAMRAAPIAAALGVSDGSEHEPLDPVRDSGKEASEPLDAQPAADAAEPEPRVGGERANLRSAPRRESSRVQQAGGENPSPRSNAELMAEGGRDAGSGGGGAGAKRRAGASVGVDYGGRRTGVAVSYSGFAPRPITVRLTSQVTHSLLSCHISSSHPPCSMFCLSLLASPSILRSPCPLSLVLSLSFLSSLSLPPNWVVRVLQVLTTRGPQLVADLLKLARDEGADELVVGLPVSWDRSEGPQAATCRQFAQSLAKPAAVQGVRVFLHDEYSTSQDALDLMIQSGRGRKDRQEMLDAFAAAVLLRSYFESQGVNATAVLPKSKLLQQKLCSRQHSPDASVQGFSAASEPLVIPDSSSAVRASAPTQGTAGSAAADATVSAMPATEQGRRAVTLHRGTLSNKGASRSSKASSVDSVQGAVGLRARGRGSGEGKRPAVVSKPLATRQMVKSRDDYDDEEDDDDSLFDGDWEAAFKLK
ncbi:unnamed protein product [Closterium sp. Naga37s-1]|nr:unnamed protein product [Closterium sp. Naga37s-1]